MAKNRQQVAAQCRAVAHLATALAQVHSDKAKLFESGEGPWDELVDMVGNNTASYMETLGDILNGMDAVTEDDDWLTPIYKEAHRLWPQSGSKAA